MALLHTVRQMADGLTERVVADDLRGYLTTAECLGLQEDLLVIAYQSRVGIEHIQSVALPPDE